MKQDAVNSAQSGIVSSLDSLYDAGFQDGVASVQPSAPAQPADPSQPVSPAPVSGSGGGFSQADIDSAVAAAVAPLNTQIASLQASANTLQGQLDQEIQKETADQATIAAAQDVIAKVAALVQASSSPAPSQPAAQS